MSAQTKELELLAQTEVHCSGSIAITIYHQRFTYDLLLGRQLPNTCISKLKVYCSLSDWCGSAIRVYMHLASVLVMQISFNARLTSHQATCNFGKITQQLKN